MHIAQSSANANAPHRLEARLLGGLDLCYDGRPVRQSAFRRRKSLQLLLRLLVSPTHQLPMDAILEQFWPEHESRAGAANLRSVLSAVRSALSDRAAPNPVGRLDPALGLDPALDLVLDVDRFEADATQGLAESDPDALWRALALYAGPLLPNLPYEEWILDRRAALARLHRQVVLALAADGEAAVEERLRVLLAEDPTDEPVSQALMRLLGAQDRTAEALRVHRMLVSALQEELGVDPSAETAALYAALPAMSAAPPSTIPVLPRHNLPAALSSFIGRSWEQAELRQLLDRTRLLTLTGPGGCGKTRLAVAVALDRLTAFPDGVRLVDEDAGSASAGVPLVQLARAEAVQLFVERVRGVRPGFALSAENAPAVGQICRRLDGIPLVLELAAARAGVLSMEQLADRLLETMRQYAWERLEETGQAHVLRGRHLEWCLALAEEAEPELRGAEQSRWLACLEREHDNLRAALRWAGEQGDAEDGLRLAGALAGFWHMRGHFSEGRRWLDTVPAAGARSCSAARAKALNGAGLLAQRQGDFGRARTLHQESLTLWRTVGDKKAIAASFINLGMVASWQGDYRVAQTMHQKGLALYRRLGDRPGVAHSLNNLGLAVYDQGDYARATAFFGESLALRRELGDKRGVAASLNNLGLVALRQGDHAQATALYEESLVLERELGNQQGITASLNNLGNVASDQGDYAKAEPLHQESLALERALGNKWGAASLLNNLGLTAYRQGDYARAKALFEEGLLLSHGLNARDVVAEALEGLAWVAMACEQASRAARLGGAALALREALGIPRTPVRRAEHDQMLQAGRAALGEEGLAMAWSDGQTLAPEQAVTLALRAT